MLKKIFKYVGIALALATGVAFLVAPLVCTVKITGTTSEKTVGLFEDLEGADLLIKDFNPFWIHALQVLIIAAFAVAAGLLVIALLNDLNVFSLRGLEKILATIVSVIGVVMLVTLIINQFANANFETTEFLGKEVKTGAGLGANVMGWLTPIFAIIGGGLAYATVETKKKAKKKK